MAKKFLVYAFNAKPYVKGTLYARVQVHQDRAAMRKHAHSQKTKLSRTICGYVDAVRAKWQHNKRVIPMACEINLCLGFLDLNTVSHECVHAAHEIVRRKYPRAWRDERDQLEEAIAYTQANLFVRVVIELHAAGLLYADHQKQRPLKFAEARITGVAA